MKKFTTTFLKGLFTLLPLLLSIYVFLWFLNWVESFSKSAVTVVWPDSLYLPGMGTLVVVILIFAFGTVVDQPFTRWAFRGIESLFQEVPIIKTVYIAIKDFTEYLQPNNRGKKSNQVVLVKFAGTDIEMIGLMTRESLHGLPEPVTKPDRVAVYFPYSYQFGGFTLFLPRGWVHPTNLPVEAAMRSIITAWLPGQDKKLEGL